MRRLLVAVALALPLAVAAAGPAHATAPSTTAVTAVSGGGFRLLTLDGSGAPVGETPMTVTGTSDGTTGTVDLICSVDGADPTTTTLTTGVPVTATGAWTWTGSARGLAGTTCALRAVPTGPVPADLSPFAGQLVSVASDQPGATDYATAVPQRSGVATYSSAGDCGLCEQALISPGTAVRGADLFTREGAFGVDDSVPASPAPVNARSGLLVDGVAAFLPHELATINPALTPPSITHRVAYDPTTGAATIGDLEPVSRCSDAVTFPPTAASCSSATSAGVSLLRLTVQSQDGRVVTVRDTWTSTDGQEHAIDAQVTDAVGGTGTQGWRLPWLSGQLGPQGAGQAYGPAPDGPTTITVVRDLGHPPGLTNPVGTITTSVAPSSTVFDSGLVYLQLLREVPAGGSATLTQTYAIGTDEGSVAAPAQAAATAAPPGLTITGASGTGAGSTRVTLLGSVRAGANTRPTAVTVVGQGLFPVAADGTWAAPVTLHPGTNVLTATTSDDTGLVAGAQLTVVVGDPLTQGTAKVTKVSSPAA